MLFVTSGEEVVLTERATEERGVALGKCGKNCVAPPSLVLDACAEGD